MSLNVMYYYNLNLILHKILQKQYFQISSQVPYIVKHIYFEFRKKSLPLKVTEILAGITLYREPNLPVSNVEYEPSIGKSNYCHYLS